MQRALLLLLGIFALTQLVSVVHGDACTFTLNVPPGNPAGVAAPYASIKACFDAVPFSSTYRDQTVNVLRDLFNLYSFTDIAASTSGAGFNLNVDVFAELDSISQTTYPSDYAMVTAFQTLFNRLYDAHATYASPTPYSGFTLVRPFVISTSKSNGNLVFKALKETETEGATFSTFYQFAFGSAPTADIAGSIGKEITQINGIPTLDYLQQVADHLGQYKSRGVRLNSILTGSFSAQDTRTAPLAFGTEIYTFADGTTADFSEGLPVFTLALQFTDIPSLEAKLAPANRRSEQEEQTEETLENPFRWIAKDTAPPHIKANKEMLNNQRMAMREMSPQEAERRRQQLEDRVLNPRSSLQIINASMDNTVIAGHIVLDGVDYVVLQITGFAPAGDATVQWLLSFQSAVKQAVDYGEANGINNLILDLSGNGGGLVCLSVATRIALFPGYNANPGAASAGSDYRVGNLGTNSRYSLLIQNAQGTPSDFVEQCTTNAINDSSWFFPTSSYNRGGKSSEYTNSKLIAFNCFKPAAQGGAPFLYSDPAGLNWQPSFFFDKIIALTDGRCGSACSQFLSIAMADNTITALSYGGRADEVPDTSSFCGGNVEDWKPFVASSNKFSALTGLTLSDLPTSATTRFNYLESYAPGGNLPREFTVMPATANLDFWNDGTDQLDALYTAAAAYFPSAVSSPKTITCNKAQPGPASPAGRATSSWLNALQSLL